MIGGQSRREDMDTHQLKYGRVEAERRFLVAEFPGSLAFGRGYRIVDRYISQSRLRLRRIEDAERSVVYKLARKLPAHRPGQGVMGNRYLDEPGLNPDPVMRPLVVGALHRSTEKV